MGPDKVVIFMATVAILESRKVAKLLLESSEFVKAISLRSMIAKSIGKSEDWKINTVLAPGYHSGPKKGDRLHNSILRRKSASR